MTRNTNNIYDHGIRQPGGNEREQILDSIGLRMLSCGELHSKSGDLLTSGSSDGRQLFFVLSGGGSIRSADYSHEIGEKMAFLLLPESERIYQADHSDPWHCAWINLTGNACDGLLRAIGLSRDRPYIQLDQTMITIARRTLSRMNEEVGEDGSDLLETQLRNTSSLLEMFALLRERGGPDTALEDEAGNADGLSGAADKRARKGLAYVRAAEQYIMEHYAEPLRMDDLAKAIGITPYYLSHVFKQYRNTSPSRVLTQFRIEDSKRLLVETDWSVGDIAAKSGYPNTLNFSKVFRKIVGCSPSTYRRLRRKRNPETDVGNEWTDEI